MKWLLAAFYAVFIVVLVLMFGCGDSSHETDEEFGATDAEQADCTPVRDPDCFASIGSGIDDRACFHVPQGCGDEIGQAQQAFRGVATPPAGSD